MGQQLSQMGFGFTLICPAEYRDMSVRRSAQDGTFRVVTLPRLSERTIMPGMVLRTALSQLLYRLGKRDVVHVCAPSFPETFGAAAAARLRGRPLIVDIDDWWGTDPDGHRSDVEARYEQVLERKAVGFADSVIVASAMLRDKVQPYTGKQVGILPNGINPGDFGTLDHDSKHRELCTKYGIPPDSLLIATPADGYFTGLLSEVSALLEKAGSNVYLLVIGDSVSSSPGKHLLSAPKMERIRWLETFCGADAILFLMRRQVWEMARFPIKLAEFMATGRPIISSAVGESLRVLNEAGYGGAGALTVSNSAGGIMRGIQSFTGGREVAERTAERARNYALTSLSWAEIAAAYAARVDSMAER